MSEPTFLPVQYSPEAEQVEEESLLSTGVGLLLVVTALMLLAIATALVIWVWRWAL